jgi:Kef-type K+ transport system membrane component KefB
MFKYPARTALAVGLSMAQIGEFAFVLLSVASQLGLLPYQVYMLLMGEQSCSCQRAPQANSAPQCLPTSGIMDPEPQGPPCSTSDVPGTLSRRFVGEMGHCKRELAQFGITPCGTLHSIIMCG